MDVGFTGYPETEEIRPRGKGAKMKKSVRASGLPLKSLFISAATARRIEKKFEQSQDARQSLRHEWAWGIVGSYGLYFWSVRHTKSGAIAQAESEYGRPWKDLVASGMRALKILFTYDDGKPEKGKP